MQLRFKITTQLPALIIAASLVALIAGEGCSHKPAQKEEAIVPAQTSDSELGSSDAGNALGLRTVHFKYDSDILLSADKSVLNEDAGILRVHPSIRVQIEGHCDQRGGIQYNIALGERRAKAARDFLMDQGISGDRLTTISYGKEKPLDPAVTEDAYAKNRRDNLAITAR